MPTAFQPLAADSPLGNLRGLTLERTANVLHVRLNRANKRNSISDELLAQLHTVFVAMPKDIQAAVLSGEGQHFCAGLDLSEVSERTVSEGMQHSRAWHACFDAIQFGPVPVVAVLHGAVVGGGLELAASAHLRVAEDTAFYGLPEGTRGIFVGGGPT
jgi:(methylthio)acryloyl-CoA hydratase